MTFIPDDPRTWPLKVPIIAHDVGRSSDRSTAVVGGNCPFTLGARLLGIKEFAELPVGLYGSELASALAVIDQTYNRDCLIVADLSSDATYGETLFDTFGRRVVGVQIGRSGDGTTWEQRRVKHGVIRVYNVGRTFLIELLLAEMRDNRVRFANSAESLRAYEQLMALEPEQRDSGTRSGSTMISPCLSPCSPGPPSICIWKTGPNRSSTPTGCVDPGKKSVGEPGHDGRSQGSAGFGSRRP